MEEQRTAPATLDTTVPASASAAAASAPSPRSPLPSAATAAGASDPGSPSGVLHASYREFRLREATRIEEESRPPPPPPKDPSAPFEIAADQPGARLLEPVQPFYSSALLEPTIRSPSSVASSARKPNAAASNRRSNSMQQPASAAAAPASDAFNATPRRPLSASAKKPSASASSASASSTPRSASTKKDYPGVTRSTALSDSRKAGVADRKESMRILRAEQALPDLLDMKHRPTTPTQSTNKAQKKFPFLQKSTGSAAGVNGRAATPSAAAAAANGHSSEEQNGTADAAAAPASGSSSSKKPTPSNATATAASKRPVRTSLAPSFGSSAKKPAGIDSAPSPRASKSASASAASSSSTPQRTDFSALKRKGKQHETSFEVLAPASSPKRVTIQEPDGENKDEDEPDAESTALTTTTQPSSKDRRDPASLTPEETAAMLAPRPSQVLATLDSPTPYFPAATPVRTGALIPASMALENLPASSAKKVPLALAGRTGLAHECASCHELHLRVDRQKLEIHRLSEAQQKLEHVRLQAEQLGRERQSRLVDLDLAHQKLAKSEARCATLSNQLTTLRLDQEKHVKILLVGTEEKITRASKEAAEKSTAAALAEAAAARSERDAVVLEKKGLVSKLSHIAQAKRALEKSLASLEDSYKTLQEHTEIVLRQKAAAEAAAADTRGIEGQEQDAEQLAGERARIRAEAAQARGERDAFELEAQSLRAELDAFRASHARNEAALESQEALAHAYDSSQSSLDALSAHAKDLEAQLRFERDQVRVLRADLARAQQAADAVAQRDANHTARETERGQIESSYVTELAAVRQEIAQLQREKSQTLEENARMRRQMDNMARNLQVIGAANASAASGANGYQSSPFDASSSSSSFAATQPQPQRQQQQHQQAPSQQRQPPQSQHQQLSSPKSASSAYEAQESHEVEDEAELHEEEEARRPTSAPSQPFVRPTRASTLSAAAANAKSKIPRSASTSRERAPSSGSQAAVLETPSPRPRMASPLPSPHPKASTATAVSPRKPLYTPPTHSTSGAASTSSSTAATEAQPRSGSISARVKSPAPLSSAAMRSSSSKAPSTVSPASSSAASAAAAARAKSVSPAPRPLSARNSGSAAVPSSASKFAATQQREAASQPLSGSDDTQDGAVDGESVPASASGSNAAEDSFAEQLNSYLRPVESSSSPAPAGYAGSSLFSPSSGAFSASAGPVHTAEDHAATARMLASLQYFKAAYSDSHETQQALLVLEGLIQQAGILRTKIGEKQAALFKLSGVASGGVGGSDPAADRLRAESRVLSQTLDLTKDNIRTHYAALQASLGSKDPSPSPNSASTPWRPSSAATASTTPASSFRPNFAFTSPPATGGASSSRFGAWNATLPLTQTSPAPVSLRGNFTSTSGLFSPTAATSAAAAPSARFVPAASSAGASAFFQQQPSIAGSGPSSFVSRSFTPSAFAPSSSSSAAAGTAPAGSFLSTPFSSTFHGGSSLGVSGTLASQPSSSSGSAVVPSTVPAAGGSTFNLQVSKDAKNIYITHSTGPVNTQQQQHHVLQSPSAATPSFQPRPPLLTAPFNSPAPVAASAAAGSSFAASPFASPVGTASLRPMHQHAAFHSTYSPMPSSSGASNASFLSPSGASFAARTPAAPRPQ